MKKVACFNDVFSFWQCWNHIKVNDLTKFFYDDSLISVPSYKINDGDKRISQLSLFRTGITPTWEDQANCKGSENQISFEGPKVKLDELGNLWEKVVLELITKNIIHHDQITGIRVVDKVSIIF